MSRLLELYHQGLDVPEIGRQLHMTANAVNLALVAHAQGRSPQGAIEYCVPLADPLNLQQLARGLKSGALGVDPLSVAEILVACAERISNLEQAFDPHKGKTGEPIANEKTGHRLPARPGNGKKRDHDPSPTTPPRV